MKLWLVKIQDYNKLVYLLDENLINVADFVFKEENKAKSFYKNLILDIKKFTTIQNDLKKSYVFKEEDEKHFTMNFCEQDDYEWYFNVEIKEIEIL